MKWPKTLTIEDARKAQNFLSRKVQLSPLKKEPRYIAGVDAAFSDDQVFAAACLYLFPELALIERQFAVQKLLFPYVPGFLSFREGPAIMTALEKLAQKPDLLLVDGQGIAHPRGVGIASHLGVLLNLPAIGCAKSRLVGEHNDPGIKRGRWSRLIYGGRAVGAVVRTKDGVRPLFVSPGHRVNTDDAIRLTIACSGKHRIPEPLRCADMLSRKMKKI
ncbi:MAG TPA: deoxyribonuclease V [Nitrospirota bacterium]|nr:deoxyribonuclease V [Nitrospirota bacterium]